MLLYQVTFRGTFQVIFMETMIIFSMLMEKWAIEGLIDSKDHFSLL